MKRNTLFIITLIGIATSLVAFALRETTPPPTTSYAWLEGSWVGDGFGGTSEEVWSHPAPDGSMMGMFRHLKGDGSLNFYELIILDAKGMRLKHFTADLHSWEDKEGMVSFAMISADEETISMDGLSYERTSPTTMEVKLRMKQGDGFRTEVFRMKRKE